MGKQFISSGFIVILLLGWAAHPSICQKDASQKSASQKDTCHSGITLLSAPSAGDFFQAEIDILSQPTNSFKVIKFSHADFNAIFLSTLYSHRKVTNSLPLECNEARKKLLLSFLYPAHEFS